MKKNKEKCGCFFSEILFDFVQYDLFDPYLNYRAKDFQFVCRCFQKDRFIKNDSENGKLYDVSLVNEILECVCMKHTCIERDCVECNYMESAQINFNIIKRIKEFIDKFRDDLKKNFGKDLNEKWNHSVSTLKESFIHSYYSFIMNPSEVYVDSLIYTFIIRNLIQKNNFSYFIAHLFGLYHEHVDGLPLLHILISLHDFKTLDIIYKYYPDTFKYFITHCCWIDKKYEEQKNPENMEKGSNTLILDCSCSRILIYKNPITAIEWAYKHIPNIIDDRCIEISIACQNLKLFRLLVKLTRKEQFIEQDLENAAYWGALEIFKFLLIGQNLPISAVCRTVFSRFPGGKCFKFVQSLPNWEKIYYNR